MEADQVGLQVLIAPLGMLTHGVLDMVMLGASNRMHMTAQRVVGDRIETLKVPTSFAPEHGVVGYTWICRSASWPLRWYALADLSPFGRMNQIIPDEAVAALSQEFVRIRRLNPSFKDLPAPKELRKGVTLPKKRTRATILPPKQPGS